MTILFICTGNTCRSPMAACLMKHLCQKAGIADMEILSAGVNAWDGEPASSGAQHAMARRGLSLADHRSQSVSEELLRRADLVLCLSQSHALALQQRFSTLPQVACFSPAIPDPFGGSDAVYEACAAAMEDQLTALTEHFTSA